MRLFAVATMAAFIFYIGGCGGEHHTSQSEVQTGVADNVAEINATLEGLASRLDE